MTENQNSFSQNEMFNLGFFYLVFDNLLPQTNKFLPVQFAGD